jgi:hypothetical protein
MSLLPLQYVLLFAIAISQIFGGIWCCCLRRALFNSPAMANGASLKDLSGETSSAVSNPIRKCPKCNSSNSGRTTGKFKSAPLTTSCSSISDGGQCQCLKLVIKATASNETAMTDNKSIAWSGQVFDSEPIHEAIALKLRKFEVPIRFGGRSWLTFACVWKN